VGGGTRCRGGVRAAAVGEGGPSVGACCGDGGGVGARATVGVSDEASERGGVRDEEWVGDADATVHDTLKRGSWD
jgi:hypothetical protein